ILVDVNTLADGEPRNNFLKRALTWNADGALAGARHVTLGGHYAYVTTPEGVVVVDLDEPLKPRIAARVALAGARASALQFRYLFVTTAAGLEVIDVTLPERARRVEGARVPLAAARGLYVARTYAYVAAGKEGLAIVDVENPEKPRLFTRFDADGKLDDARDVVVGSTNASLFAYVADGSNGLKVVQLTAPDTQPRFYGFSPEPRPRLIAWKETASPANALAKGLDRDRAVDETGGQIAVFGRIGARPFTLEEQRRFYLNPDGSVWKVKD
ncbi:MAG: LVIVD repeat-containing protein, partial [Usitatibacter sp.]